MSNEALKATIERMKEKLPNMDEDLRPAFRAEIAQMEADLDVAEAKAASDEDAEAARQWRQHQANEKLDEILSTLPVPREAKDFYPDKDDDYRMAMAAELQVQAQTVTSAADTAAAAATAAAEATVQAAIGGAVEPQAGAGAPVIDPAELAKDQADKLRQAQENGDMNAINDLLHDQTVADLETVSAQLQPQPVFPATPPATPQQ